MPAAHLTKEQLIQHLLAVFRQYGYEGATLTRISEATGLGKASLYHHFPKGKESMASAVLEYNGEWFNEHVFGVLTAPGKPLERLQSMTDKLSIFFNNGNSSCILAMLILGDVDNVFRAPVQQAITTWVAMIKGTLIEANIPEAEAQNRAEGAVIKIQGALIVSRGLKDNTSFQRLMKQLPKELLSH